MIIMKKMFLLFVSFVSLSFFHLHSNSEAFITITAELEDWDVEISMDFAPGIYSYIPSFGYVENNKIRSPYLSAQEEIDALKIRRGITIDPEKRLSHPMFVVTNTILRGGNIPEELQISIEPRSKSNLPQKDRFCLYPENHALYPLPIKLFLGDLHLSCLSSPHLQEIFPCNNLRENLLSFHTKRLYLYIPKALLPVIEPHHESFAENFLITLKAGC